MAKSKSELLTILEVDDTESYTLNQNERLDNVLDTFVMSGFVEQFLLPYYDSPQPLAAFHLVMWEDYCSDHTKVAEAAPRGHGKTTTNTIAFAIANILFKCADFVVIGSNTEEQAIKILDGIRLHIQFNPRLKEAWPGLKIVRDTQTELIIAIDGTWYACLRAKSSTQQFRGTFWGVKRPNLILLDDFESPEEVMNKDIRERINAKLYTDILLCGSDYCRYRVTGTVLHADSMLERTLQSPEWVSHRFSAHNADFSKVLFPGKFTKESLTAMRRMFEENGTLDLYYGDMLNSPVSMGDRLLQGYQFQEMTEDHWQKNMRFYVTIDFAISESQKADFTVFLVFGICENGLIYVVHVERFRASADTPFKIEETFFDLNDKFHPECFIAETEKIDKAIMPYIRLRQVKENNYFTVHQVPSTKSKIQRGMGMRSRMIALACFFHKEAAWYPDFEYELLQATPEGIKARNDDQWDAFSMIGLALDRYVYGPTDEEAVILQTVEYNDTITKMFDDDPGDDSDGRCDTTGY